MSRYCFYDDPISRRRVAFNSEKEQVAFMVKDLIDDEPVRAKVCSDRGFPFAEWKDGRVIGDPTFLPTTLIKAIFFAQSQKILELENKVTVATIVSDTIILDAVRYRYLREVIGADESGIFIPCGNSRVFPKVTDAAIDLLIARRVG
jgi:hypothetical protein